MSDPLYAYVVSFDGSVGRKRFTDAIDREAEIANWYACLPNTVFVVSALHAKPLSRLLREVTGVDRIIVVDANTDRSGWLPKRAWRFLREPKRA